jgi:hypothetical protein
MPVKPILAAVSIGLAFHGRGVSAKASDWFRRFRAPPCPCVVGLTRQDGAAFGTIRSGLTNPS